MTKGYERVLDNLPTESTDFDVIWDELEQLCGSLDEGLLSKGVAQTILKRIRGLVGKSVKMKDHIKISHLQTQILGMIASMQVITIGEVGKSKGVIGKGLSLLGVLQGLKN